MGTDDPLSNSGKARTPWWRSSTAKFLVALFGALGALASGLATVPPIAGFLNAVSSCGWSDALVRVMGVGVAFVATIWTLWANHKDKAEIASLHAQLAAEKSQGLSHAVAKFCEAVKTMSDTNAGGWTPENVERFQPEALKIGKSLLDHLSVPDARLCLYVPKVVETDPEGAEYEPATVLRNVCFTFVPGRHGPRRTISESKADARLFGALENETPKSTNRKLPKRTKSKSKKWKSAICMGVWAGDEPFAVLTVDSTAKDAFDHTADGVLTLVAGLLRFAEVEQNRHDRAQNRIPELLNATLNVRR